MTKIEVEYTKFYKSRNAHSRVYPTEFVVRTFLSKYPNLCLREKLPAGGG